MSVCVCVFLSIFVYFCVCFSVFIYLYFSICLCVDVLSFSCSTFSCLLLLFLLVATPPSPPSSVPLLPFLVSSCFPSLLIFLPSSLPLFLSSSPVLLFFPFLFLLLLVLRLFLFSVFSSSITGFFLSFSSHFLASSLGPPFLLLFSFFGFSFPFGLSLFFFRFPFVCFFVLGLFGLIFRFFLLLSFFLYLCLFLCSSGLSFVFRFSRLLPFFLLFRFSSFTACSFIFSALFCIPPRFSCRLLAVRFLWCLPSTPPSPSPSSACSLRS